MWSVPDFGLGPDVERKNRELMNHKSQIANQNDPCSIWTFRVTTNR
jgi:hypothetical protein